MVIHNFTSKQVSEIWNNFERTGIIIILSLKLLCEIVRTVHAFILFTQLPKKYKIHTVTAKKKKQTRYSAVSQPDCTKLSAYGLIFIISFPFQMELSSYWILVVPRLLSV